MPSIVSIDFARSPTSISIMAAPSKYTENLARKICDRISKGDSFSAACVLEGIQAETGFNWKERKPGFLEAVQEAEAKRKSKLIAALYQGIEKGSITETTTTRLGDSSYEEVKVTIDKGARARYAMWALPRIDPENWSEEAKIDKRVQSGIREWLKYLMVAVDDHSKTQISTALMAAGFEGNLDTESTLTEAANTAV
jgi:hypothetical protein